MICTYIMENTEVLNKYELEEVVLLRWTQDDLTHMWEIEEQSKRQ